MTPADLKAEGQMRSLFAVSDTTRQDFERILRDAPEMFDCNTIREQMDAAQIPPSARGGLFAQAVTAGLIAPLTTPDGYEIRTKSKGASAHNATVRIYRRCAA